MHWTDRRRRFRALLAGERCIHPGSVFDPISARIAEDLGFELGMFAGSTASLSEFAGQAYRINRAGNLPLLVDADHGYGNALNAKRTVEELETAGVSALSLEDTDLPTPYGIAKPRLVSIAEGVGKMKAALAGRQDPALCIAGRTSAVSITGVDDAIARGKAYEEAGVDALFFVGVRTRAELDALSAATRVPLILDEGFFGWLTANCRLARGHPRAMTLRRRDQRHRDAIGVRLAAQDHAPQRAHIGKVAAPGDGDVIFLGHQVVGRVEMDPAGHLAAPYRHPGVARVGAAQGDLVLGVD